MPTLPGGPWQLFDEFLAAKGIRFAPPTLSTTTGGKHATRSRHYPTYGASARDYGQSGSDMPAILAALEPWAWGGAAPIVELFGPGTCYRDGRAIIPSAALRDAHRDHVHAALEPSRAAGFRVRWQARMAEEEEDVALVDVLVDPQVAGGVWALLEDGTVRNFRGARDLGQPAGHAFWGNRKAKQFEPNARGGFDVLSTDPAPDNRYGFPL